VEAGGLTLHLLPRSHPFSFFAKQQMSATLTFEQESDEGESDRALRTRRHVQRETRVVSVCCLVFRRRSYRRQQGQEAQHQARCQTWLEDVWSVGGSGERGISRARIEYRGCVGKWENDETERTSRRNLARCVIGVAGDNKLARQ
jgi:hypothetical protein